MSTPSEKLLDNAPLYTPPQVYRHLLHTARDADRRHLSDRSIAEADYGGVQFESYVDDDYGDVLQSGYRYRVPEDESVDLEEVLHEGTIDWDAPVPALESSRLSAVSGVSIAYDEGEFLEDSYFPGYLDDAVNGRVPAMEGVSLLEAFDRRLEHELKQVRERLGLSHTSRVSTADVSGVSDSSVREEDVVAAMVGVEIDRKLQNRTETELTKAIDAFVDMQFMHEYYTKFEVMQRMSKQVVGQLVPEEGKQEASTSGSPIGKRYPKFDVVTVEDGETGRPLEIVTYIGSTRNQVGK